MERGLLHCSGVGVADSRHHWSQSKQKGMKIIRWFTDSLNKKARLGSYMARSSSDKCSASRRMPSYTLRHHALCFEALGMFGMEWQKLP